MQRLIYLGLIVTTLGSGCDARVDSEYKGEPLLAFSGSLSIDNPQAAPDLVPALAFMDRSYNLHILDVDTQGSFPGSFTLSVMSPPPPAALHHVAGAPSVALAYITALPAQHESVLQVPPEVDGAGALSWCDGPGDTNCFRRLEQCIAGTDQCYRELARCHLVPAEGGGDEKVCDEILEQSGDPGIANAWHRFGGLSEHHFVLYVSASAAAGTAEAYLHEEIGVIMAYVFGRGPITAGYHLIQSRFLTDAETPASEACAEASELAAVQVVNMLHQTNFPTPRELSEEVVRMAPAEIGDHVYFQDYMKAVVDALWERDCLDGSGGIAHARLPAGEPVQIKIGTRDVQPVW